MGPAMVGARGGLKARAQSGSGHRGNDYFFLAGCVLEMPPLRLGAAAMTFSFTFFGLRASLEPRDFSPTFSTPLQVETDPCTDAASQPHQFVTAHRERGFLMAALRPQRVRDRNGSSPRLEGVVPGSNVDEEESRGPAYCPARPANQRGSKSPWRCCNEIISKECRSSRRSWRKSIGGDALDTATDLETKGA